MAGMGAALRLQWKIPTRGMNSIQQIFMAPPQCEVTGSGSVVVLWCCWQRELGAGDKATEDLRGTDWILRTWPHVERRDHPLGTQVQQLVDPTL